MAGKYLSVAAAAALFALGAAGTAHAADVTPVVVPPIVTPVVVAPVGPKIELTSEHWLQVAILPGEFTDLYSFHDFDLKVTSARGLGFELYAGTLVHYNPAIHIEDATAYARLFMARGDIEVGVFTQVWLDPAYDGLGIGADFSLDNDRLTMHSYVNAVFYSGFEGIATGVDATLHFGERFDIYGGFDAFFPAGGSAYLGAAWLGAQVHLGPISPYATVFIDGMDRGFEIGAEFEHKFGDGPLSLHAYGEANFLGYGMPVFEFGVGLKFSIGGDDS